MLQADGRAAAEENPAQKKGRDPRIERRKNAPEREIAAKEAALEAEIEEMYIRRDEM